MALKISELTLGTANTGDFIPSSRTGINFKLNLRDAVGTMAESVASFGGEGTTDAGKLAKFRPDGSLRASEAIRIYNPIELWYLEISNAELSATRLLYAQDDSGYIALHDHETISHKSPGYQLNTGAFLTNSSNLTLTNSHNGKNIISSNTTGIIYTVASGLIDGFSCSIVQTSTGSTTFTGAAGVSLNSYGGLTQVAGQYGSAYVGWIQSNSYVLSGNLS